MKNITERIITVVDKQVELFCDEMETRDEVCRLPAQNSCVNCDREFCNQHRSVRGNCCIKCEAIFDMYDLALEATTKSYEEQIFNLKNERDAKLFELQQERDRKLDERKAP